MKDLYYAFIRETFNEFLPTHKPAFKPRPEQIDYAKAIAKTLLEKGGKTSAAALEMDTGMGKTLGYLVPLLFHAAVTKERVLVSTFTRQLQQQILQPDGDLSFAQKAVLAHLNIPLEAAERVGRNNFVSPDRVRRIAKNTPIAEWVESTNTYRLDEYIDRYGQLPEDVSPLDIMANKRNKDGGFEAYLAHCQQAKEADIIITNHSLLALYVQGFADLDSNDRIISSAVVDEANRLRNAAEGYFDEYVSFYQLAEELTEVSGLIKATIEGLKSFRGSKNNTPLQLGNLPAATVKDLIEMLKVVIKVFGRPDDEYSKTQQRILSMCLSALLGKSRRFMTPLFVEHGSEWPVLKIAAATPESMFVNLAKSQDKPLIGLNAVVLTGATLTNRPDENLENIFQRIGFYRESFVITAVERYTHESFGRLSFVVSPPEWPKPLNGEQYNKDWVNNATRMLGDCLHNHKRVLVLCASFKDVNTLKTRLVGQLSHVFFHEEGLLLDDLIREYKALAQTNNRAVLISPSAWEGVDLPGMIDAVFVLRLPYQAPTHERYIALNNKLVNKGLSGRQADGIIFSQQIGESSQRFRQGLGRPIRQESDSATVWIADPRFPRPSDAKQGRSYFFVKCIPERFMDDWRKANTYIHESHNGKAA